MRESSVSDPISEVNTQLTKVELRNSTAPLADHPRPYDLLLDPETRAFYESRGWTLEKWLDLGIELDNAVIEGFEGVTFALHL